MVAEHLDVQTRNWRDKNPNITLVTIMKTLGWSEQIIQAYSGTFSNIQPCSDILWDIEAYRSNVVLRVSRKKNKIFPCGAPFCVAFDEIFIEVP